MNKMPFLAFVPADLEDLLNNARGREKMLSLQPREQIMLVYMALDIVHAVYVGFFRFLTEAVYIAVEQDTVDREVDTGDLCALWEEYQNSRQELVSRVLLVWIHITHMPPTHCPVRQSLIIKGTGSPKETFSFKCSPYALLPQLGTPTPGQGKGKAEPTSKQRGYLLCMSSGPTIPMPLKSEYPRGTTRTQMLCPHDAMFGYTCDGTCGMHHITNRNNAGGYPKGYLQVIHRFVRNNPGKVGWHPLEAQNVCIDVNHATADDDDSDSAATAQKRQRKEERKAKKASKKSKRGRG